LLILGSIGISAVRNPVEIFLCAELVTISAFYILFTVTVSALYPSKADPAGIFIGGVARSPYISANELYSPGIPLIYEEFDMAGRINHNNLNEKVTEA
jgi:NADH:ubiquinone oxidoreductase subunit K